MNENNFNGTDISFVVFDLDGVLADTISSWVWIHEHFGVNNDVSYYAYMNNEIDDMEFMRRDIALWLQKKKTLHIGEVERILDSVPLMPGFITTMKILKFLGIRTAIVSAGLEQLAMRVGKVGGIKHILANSLETDKEGYLTGEGILHVSLRAKGEVVKQLKSTLGLKQNNIASIGNGEIDSQMFKESCIGIAFNPHDDNVINNADIVIHKKDLTEILKHLCKFDELPNDLKAECINSN